MTRQEQIGLAIVAEARTWIGTPYHHGQVLRELGCDCAGLIVGVWHTLGLVDARFEMNGTPRLMPEGYLREKFAKYCDELDEDEATLPGDVLLMRVVGIEQHAGIYAGDDSIIHTLVTIDRVGEQPLYGWRKRITGRFRLKVPV